MDSDLKNIREKVTIPKVNNTWPNSVKLGKKVFSPTTLSLYMVFRPMPEPTDQKYNANVPYGKELAHPGSTQRDINVMPEPSGKRHMPPLPIFGHVPGEVRELKVGHQFYPEQFGGPDGYVRIPAK